MGEDKARNSHLTQRRQILTAFACAPLLSTTRLAWALADQRELSFSHTHTGERLKVTYFENGVYLPDALSEINFLLRDFRTREVIEIDRRLLDIVHLTQQSVGSSGTLEIISGYRSPKTNEMLRANSSGVAKKSFHMNGQAIDIRLTDVATDKLPRRGD